MSSLLEATPSVQGAQHPRVYSCPPYIATTGLKAVELCSMAGLDLDEWQQLVLVDSLGRRQDGKWAAFEIGEVISRQNGKGGTLEARELAALYLIEDDRLTIHSAHQFDTSLEAFGRLLALIENTPKLHRRVKRVSNSHGQEGITLKDGKRIRFRTRTKGGGRGFTGDCLILDEAMDIPEATHAALLPTLSARPNPQVWYTGSAVDQMVDDNGVVFARIRERGQRGGDPSLAYFEFSADLDINRISKEETANVEHWMAANPALGIRISPEYVARERATLSTRKFAVERLGVGDWPRTDDAADRVIDLAKWDACTDHNSISLDPVCFAFDVSPGQTHSAIASCGYRADGQPHVEVIDHRRGTHWVADRIADLKRDHRPHLILCDASSAPASALVADVERQIGEVYKVTAGEHAAAFGMICNGVLEEAEDGRGRLRHLGTPELRVALEGATTRPMGDGGSAWSRKNSEVDISPLVAATLAIWGNSTRPKRVVPRVISLALNP